MLHNVYIDSKKWKDKLNKIIKYSHDTNLPESTIEKCIKPIISFTILTTSPDTEPEKLFYEMWHKANSKEKHSLTKMLLKIIRE
ncbi:DUF3243 family protein [Sedimentibacter sp. zth1]|uniref:DUF3243 family protein n=1 Tax=Sedimentibacter sp. zth1 TaxID=2816908 RepID=UPI001A92FB4A|nr:DUF3243 family protein [Sedimentibacter sp. zth1]QSX07142.1 DUF3243 family protein [Sedimentibacter sp. zth1]